jgi:hypothetical protein
MITRIWHRWTSLRNSEAYESLLRHVLFPSIENKYVNGYRKISLLKRKLYDEAEFIIVMLSDNIDSVKEFAGEDYEKSYVPEKIRHILLRHDEHSQNYVIIIELIY